MTTLREKKSLKSHPELPPIIVIDARDLPLREPPVDATGGEEKIVVLFPKPTVSHAFHNFRGSTAMLVKVIVVSVVKYFARINRGHIHRQRNI